MDYRFLQTIPWNKFSISYPEVASFLTRVGAIISPPNSPSRESPLEAKGDWLTDWCTYIHTYTVLGLGTKQIKSLLYQRPPFINLVPLDLTYDNHNFFPLPLLSLHTFPPFLPPSLPFLFPSMSLHCDAPTGKSPPRWKRQRRMDAGLWPGVYSSGQMKETHWWEYIALNINKQTPMSDKHLYKSNYMQFSLSNDIGRYSNDHRQFIARDNHLLIPVKVSRVTCCLRGADAHEAVFDCYPFICSQPDHNKLQMVLTSLRRNYWESKGLIKSHVLERINEAFYAAFLWRIV